MRITEFCHHVRELRFVTLFCHICQEIKRNLFINCMENVWNLWIALSVLEFFPEKEIQIDFFTSFDTLNNGNEKEFGNIRKMKQLSSIS